jgi:hypothetical protein
MNTTTMPLTINRGIVVKKQEEQTKNAEQGR